MGRDEAVKIQMGLWYVEHIFPFLRPALFWDITQRRVVIPC